MSAAGVLLREALRGLHCLSGDPGELRVREVTEDSRQVGPGTLFLAVQGMQTDGRRFVPDAIARGAEAVVVTGGASYEAEAAVPVVSVAEGREAVGHLAAAVYAHPSRKLALVGITGTNGKTTTSFLLAEAARAGGVEPGVIGTTGYSFGGKLRPAATTTPSAATLQQVLAQMVEAGVRFCAVEVSSHAVTQRREAGCEFAALCFTNLSQDHLDYHGDMERYFAAKRALFELHPGVPVAINVDGDWGRRLVREIGERSCIRVSLRADADAELRVLESKHTREGTWARVMTPAGEATISSAMVGDFNLANICLAMAGALAAGLSLEAARGAAALPSVPGRLERVGEGDVHVYVDYAHTPDALERVLDALRPATEGQLITVFGCGGDRDRSKRPLMGEVAAQRSDLCVVTSDNPRSEAPEAIIEDILPGVGDAAHQVEVDRERAIFTAIAQARPGDTVLIAGKGHEDYQIVGDERRHFDDREVATAALRQREEATL